MIVSLHFQAMIDAVKHLPINIPLTKNALKNVNLKIEMIMYKANKDKTITIDKRQMGVMLFHVKVSSILLYTILICFIVVSFTFFAS